MDLSKWPFSSEAASRLLDTDLIEQQGDFFLRRGLNIRNLIAFVGSGVSMAYGRVSWGELAEIQVSGIMRVVDSRDNLRPAIEKLANQLKGLLRDVKREKPEAIILAMQISEQIWSLADSDLCRALCKEFYHRQAEKLIDDERFLEKTEEERESSQRKLSRKSIKEETLDETRHVQRILSDPYYAPGGQADVIHEFARRQLFHDELKREWRVKKRSVSVLFSKDVLSTIAAATATLQGSQPPTKQLLDLARTVANILDKACDSPAAHAKLNPCNYSALGLVIDSIRSAKRRGHRVDRAFAKIGRAITRAYRPHPAVPMRQTVIERAKDPLWQLAMALDIKRFVTTNYDLEIERLIDDIGFERTSYTTQEELNKQRVGPLGGQTREIVLDESNTTELLDLAASPGSYNIQVAHLHGRALEDEDIVLTERDYQAKYLGEEPHKTVAREGLDLLFGGNPLVFVGVSLSEGDVVRPLREFRSGNSRRNQSVIALMAATGDEESRKTAVMEQYIRNGIYVLHYGRVTKSDPLLFNEGEFWLQKVFRFTRSLTEIFDVLSDTDRPDYQSTVKYMMLKAASRRKEARLDAEPTATAFRALESDSAPCDIALEAQLLNAVWKFLEQDAGRLRQRDPDNVLYEKYYGTVLRRAVKRIEGALLTASLCSYLRGLEKRWHAWGAHLLVEQKTRLNNMRYSTRADLRRSDGKPEPLPGNAVVGDQANDSAKWFRHLVYGTVFDPATGMVSRSDTGVDNTFKEIITAWCSRFRVGQVVKGARLLLISAPRGAGKGTLHGQFALHGDFLLEPVAAGATWLPNRSSQKYASAFSASLSFSSEVASVWDGVAAFLLDPSAPAFETVESSAWQKPAGRLERIRRGLNLVSQRHESDGKRVLVVFHAFDLLFDEYGSAKNAEIRAICDAIFDDRHLAPIDFVLIVRDTRTPFYFRSDNAKAKPLRLLSALTDDPSATPPPDRAGIVRAVLKASMKIDPAGSILSDDTSLPAQNRGKAQRHDYVYFLAPRPASPHLEGETDTSRARKLLQQNRFQSDLYERICQDPAGRESKDRISREMIDAAGRHGQISADRFFEKVLDYWSMRDLPKDYVKFREYLQEFEYFPATALREDRLQVAIRHAHDFRLQELLLRHLAVIFQPVEADVLAACPRVGARVRVLCGTDPAAETMRRRVVEYGLALLSARGLCFTITDRKRVAGEPKRFRYQVHRAIQLHVHRRLGGQNTEPPESYFYSMSLYASQGRDVLLLSAKAYAFLHELVNGLIGFPREDGTIPNREDNASLQARCLRAGIGVARTLFSIGVVARFNDLGGVKVPIPPRPGYFEHHRLTLRWMLREAERLSSQTMDEWRPYYPDEIAWLYNECGVFSLAQGQSFDALSMFDAALRFAGRIEGKGDSPNRRRILLNLALCAINRGRLNEARRWLAEVESGVEEDEAVRLVAKGFKGILHYIGGEHDEAMDHYGSAIRGLTDLGRSRAVSMFLRHRGDLHRHKRRFEEANQDFSNAIDHARFSGSEDMAWFAIVAKTRMEAAQKANFKALVKRLEGAEAYADAMELPQLSAEASFVHAQILLRQGETALAAERASRALRIATLNGLTIRAIACRSLLSDIHRERGWEALAQKIKADALQAARNVGYRALLQRHANDSSVDDDNSSVPFGPNELIYKIT